jgi:WD40 repeat protein
VTTPSAPGPEPIDLRGLLAAAVDAGRAVVAEVVAMSLPEPGELLKPKVPLPDSIEGAPGQARVYPKMIMRKLALHPDGEHVFGAGGKSQKVTVWDLKTKKLAELEGHGGDVSGVAISPDGRLAISCGHDGTAIIWNIQNLQQIQLAYKYAPDTGGNRYQFEDCAFAPDGRTAYVVGPKLGLHALDVYTGRATVIDVKGRALAMSSTGKYTAVGGSDGRPVLIDLEKRVALPPLTLPREKRASILAVAFSPDGQTLATGGDDRILRLWEVGNMTLAREIIVFSATIEAIAFSPDNRRVAAGGLDRMLYLFPVKGGPPMRLPKDGKVDGAIQSLAFTSDGGRLFLGLDDSSLRLWRVPK